MKLSAFYKAKGYRIDLVKLGISYYPSKKNKVTTIDTSGYALAFCSVIFIDSILYIRGEGIAYGGSGYSLSKDLPPEIEKLKPDYSIYPDNKISYGFLSRGCIRRCSFCYVPEKEGRLRQVNTVDDIVRHKQVKFLDNNFLALPNHKEILRELITKKIKCQFNQGLDIRLVDSENSELLGRLRHIGEIIFAFDDIRYQKIIEEKLELLSWRKPWQLKLFIYTDANKPIGETLDRIKFLYDNKCLPFLMRDINVWSSPNKDLYTDLASWCNQPRLFKNLPFYEYLLKRHTGRNAERRIDFSYGLYIFN